MDFTPDYSHYDKDTAIHFREAAKNSIGSVMPAKSLELKHTIKLIQELATEIDEIETAIKRIMDEEIRSPILTIPGISYRRKYQEQNLSPVEEEYLESIKNILGLTASEE